MGVLNWQSVPGLNGAADPAVTALDGMSARNFPGIVRAIMAAMRALADDQGGSIVTTGTDNAYVAATSSGVASLRAGILLTLRFDRANTAEATLNVDGLGPKPLVDRDGVALEAGRISEGLIGQVVYDAEAETWRLAGSSLIDVATLKLADPLTAFKRSFQDRDKDIIHAASFGISPDNTAEQNDAGFALIRTMLATSTGIQSRKEIRFRAGGYKTTGNINPTCFVGAGPGVTYFENQSATTSTIVFKAFFGYCKVRGFSFTRAEDVIPAGTAYGVEVEDDTSRCDISDCESIGNWHGFVLRRTDQGDFSDNRSFNNKGDGLVITTKALGGGPVQWNFSGLFYTVGNAGFGMTIRSPELSDSQVRPSFSQLIAGQMPAILGSANVLGGFAAFGLQDCPIQDIRLSNFFIDSHGSPAVILLDTYGRTHLISDGIAEAADVGVYCTENNYNVKLADVFASETGKQGFFSAAPRTVLDGCVSQFPGRKLVTPQTNPDTDKRIEGACVVLRGADSNITGGQLNAGFDDKGTWAFVSQGPRQSINGTVCLTSNNYQKIAAVRNGDLDDTIIQGIQGVPDYNPANQADVAWKPYVPTVTAEIPGTSMWSVVSAAYQIVGKTCRFRAAVKCTAAGTGSGRLLLHVPVAAKAAQGVGLGAEVANTGKGVFGSIAAGGTGILFRYADAPVTSMVATNNEFVVSGEYEAA